MSVEIDKEVGRTDQRFEDGKKAQPSIPIVANQILVAVSKGKQGSKGKSAYESVHMNTDEYTDVFDIAEKSIDEKLEAEGVNLTEEVLHSDVSLEDFGDTTKAQRGMYFPQSFYEELDDMGNTITEAVEYYIKTPFNDRKHRMDIKQQILEYVRGERDESDLYPLASEWINAKPVPDNSESSSESEDSEDIETEEGWWDSVSSVEELREKGSSLSQKQREEKVTALTNALENDSKPYHTYNVAQLCRDIWGVSEATAEAYIEEADYQTLTVANVNWRQEVESVSDKADKRIDSSILQNNSAWKISNLDPFLKDIEAGDEVDIYRYREALESSADNGRIEKSSKQVKYASGALRDEIRSKVEIELQIVNEDIEALNS